MIEKKSQKKTAGQSVPAGKTFTTEGLFAGATQINIAHNGEIYRLRITNNSKLILTK